MSKNIKTLLVFLLIILLTFSLSACMDAADDSADTDTRSVVAVLDEVLADIAEAETDAGANDAIEAEYAAELETAAEPEDVAEVEAAVETKDTVEPDDESELLAETEPQISIPTEDSTFEIYYPYCSSVDQMKEKNKWYYTGTRDELVKQGYSPCGRCHP